MNLKIKQNILKGGKNKGKNTKSKHICNKIYNSFLLYI